MKVTLDQLIDTHLTREKKPNPVPAYLRQYTDPDTRERNRTGITYNDPTGDTATRSCKKNYKKQGK